MKGMSSADRRQPHTGITDEEIQALIEKGMNKVEIARHFTERGRKISSQGINWRIKRMQEDSNERSRFVMPWVIRSPTHTQGWVYLAAKAYGKMRAGKGVDKEDLRRMRELEEFLAEHEAVLTYDYNKGFMLRGRRPEDGPSMLAS